MIDIMRPPFAAETLPARRDPAWIGLLVTPRRSFARSLAGLRLVDFLVFLLYAAVLAFAIPHHLASDDEAQAWLLARDNSLHDLLFRRMHYEGAPGLWPCLLWLAVRLHLPFTAVNSIGGAFACAGVLLLLLRSPFPPIVRWLLPFTFFFAYQYAVIARPYTLFAPLLFLLCILYAQNPPRPILFALVAGLLVNISLHAALFSGIFVLLYLQHLRSRAREVSAKPSRVQTAFAAGIFCVFTLAAVAVALPAPDVIIAGNFTEEPSKPAVILEKFISPERLPPGAPPLDLPLDLASVRARQATAAHSGVAPAPPPRVLVILSRAILLGLDAATFPIARSNLLNILFLGALFLWFRLRHALPLLLPWFLALIASAQILILDHHTGQFAIGLLASIWLALEVHPQPAPSSAMQRTNGAFLSTSLLVILLQIGWTFHAIRYERSHPYDPGPATAEFLQTHFPGKRIAGFSYESVTTEANSPAKLFFNQDAAYWIWSRNTYPDLRRTEARLQHPDVVVLGNLIKGDESHYNQWGKFWRYGETSDPPTLEEWLKHGFHPTTQFCGERLMRMGVADTFCEVILLPNPESNDLAMEPKK
jgi:hypothetical protein